MASSSPSSVKWMAASAAILLAQSANAQVQVHVIEPSPNVDPRAFQPRSPTVVPDRAHDIAPSPRVDPRGFLPRSPTVGPNRAHDIEPSPRVDPRGVHPRSPTVGRDSHRFEILESTTDWTTTARLPLFDPALGILRRVELSISAQLTGDASVESHADIPTDVSLHFAGRLALMRPHQGLLVELTPRIDFEDHLLAFDGTVDFAGASGVSHMGIVIKEDGVPVVAEASDELLFTGRSGMHDTIDLPVSAVGTSSADGGGNMQSRFRQAASALITVSYVFDLDCNENGVADVDDLVSGSSVDADVNGIPDDCQALITQFCSGDGPDNGGPKCPCSNSTEDNTGGCLNSTGVGARLEGTGMPSVGADTFRLVASELPPGVMAVYLQGRDMMSFGESFGDGLLCISGPLRRIATQTSPETGNSMIHPASGDLPISVKLGIRPGESWSYQVWYRNPDGPCGFDINTTNGVRVVWGN